MYSLKGKGVERIKTSLLQSSYIFMFIPRAGTFFQGPSLHPSAATQLGAAPALPQYLPAPQLPGCGTITASNRRGAVLGSGSRKLLTHSPYFSPPPSLLYPAPGSCAHITHSLRGGGWGVEGGNSTSTIRSLVL